MKHLRMIAMLACTVFATTAHSGGAQEHGAAPETDRATAAAPIRVLNRTVTVLRSSFLGVPAAERAQRAQETLGRLLAKEGPGQVTLQAVPHGYAIMIDGVMAFSMVPGDADPLQQAADTAVGALSQIVQETREARNLSALSRAAGLALAATMVLLGAIWLLKRLRRWLVGTLSGKAHLYSEKLSLGGETIIHRDRILVLISKCISLLFWLIIPLLLFEWLGFVLSRFPYTRPWGEQLSRYLMRGAGTIGLTALHAIPDLIVAALIFFIARLIVVFMSGIFDRIEQSRLSIAGLDQDTVRPTRRLVSAAIWLFAVVMAYPYLPGSSTDAFKGLSVLVGLMVSLGASSAVGQAASGLILMYTRVLRPGEYVRIAEFEGTVMEVGLYTTRVGNGLGEELAIPNSLILGSITRNYSRAVHGTAYTVDATVSCGYDAPWRQVHAMLIEAARRTSGIVHDPPPQVLQTALSDFYIQYRLVCKALPTEPRSRAELKGTLHATIQDVFNEYGVQIMSPHYLSDPAYPKVVPPDKCAPPPATGTGPDIPSS